MVQIAAGLFAVAALGGLTLAALHFTGKKLPTPLALLHGGLGAAGLVTLGAAVVKEGVAGRAPIALGLFVVAALGGFFLFSYHLRGRRLPSPVVIIHALVAVAAFGLLLTVVLGA